MLTPEVKGECRRRTQITTHYNRGMQKSTSECTSHWTLKKMGYSSRRPHRVPLLSAKNRKSRLQFTQAHQNWIIEDWKKVAWSDESQFLLQHSDGRVRIWCKQHESMPAWTIDTRQDGSCLVSMVQAGDGGVMVWGICSWHSLGHSVPTEHRLHATAYLLSEYCCWPCPSLYDHLVMDTSSRTICAMLQSSNHLKLVSWTRQWAH